MGSHLFEQVPALFVWERFDQLLFGGGQDALEANDEEIADQVGVNELGSPSHVVLFEAANSFTDGGFDFSERFHSNLRAALVRDGRRSRGEVAGSILIIGSPETLRT